MIDHKAAKQASTARSRTRSRTVCTRCHEKKVKCDLRLSPSRSEQRYASCSPCLAAEAVCMFRPSHKGRHRKTVLSTVPTLSQTNHIEGPATHPPNKQVSLPHFIIEAAEQTGALGTEDGSRENITGEPLNDTSQCAIDNIPPAAQQGNIEAFFDFFYTWSPVLDPDSKATTTTSVKSALMQHTFAVLAGSLGTTLTPHAAASEHYHRARHLFYTSKAADPFERLRACMLFCYWKSGPSTDASTDSSFWWTGAAIRLAQEMGLHREPKVADENTSLKRLTWWTLYARERMIAICQGRPCVIDDDYCDVQQPQISDFPSSKTREAHIFVHWVRLSIIIGQVNKHLFKSRRIGAPVPTIAIANELVEWVQSVPALLVLPISTDRTKSFDRDVHLLYLPYFTTISLLYLNSSKSRLPEASVPAVLAAACTARIFEDYLARGCIRFLSGQAGWYISVAVLSLMHVRSLAFIADQANAQIRLLRAALNHLAQVWHSAQVLVDGLNRLLDPYTSPGQDGGVSTAPMKLRIDVRQPSSLEDLCAGDGVQWSGFFPFLTEQTSPLVAAILKECRSRVPELWPLDDWPTQLGDLFENNGHIQADSLLPESAEG